MTAPEAVRPAPAGSVVGELTGLVTRLAHEYGGCLVHDVQGRLVAHSVRVGGRAPTVSEAVLAGDTTALERGLERRRTLGLTSAGPVLQGLLDGKPALWVPLRQGGEALGGLWLLGSAPSLAVLESWSAELATLLSVAPPCSELLRLLDGGSSALPVELARAQQLWVVAASPELALTRLAHAGLAVRTCRSGDLSLAVVGAPAARELTRSLEALLDPATRAGVSDVVSSPAGLPRAKEQALLVLEATPYGACGTVVGMRARIVMRHLARALQELPPLGREPLKELAEYDAKRRCDLVGTLRAWLAADGDHADAARQLGVHPNTLRYRLQRVEQISGLDLAGDLATRMELQLRLLADA